MKTFCLKVSGEYACFTRPEMKGERVSYDVMTPSSARAIFESILWKPAIRWQAMKIEVLKPIQWASVRRNEVGSKATSRNTGIFIEDDRQQRAGLFLRDVEYLVSARFLMTEKAGAEDNSFKFIEMFERRAAKGQCFNQPYLGCREFSASFKLMDNANQNIIPITETRDLGWMLYDLDYSGSEPKPRFFRAKLEAGVVNVPDWNSMEVRG